MLHLLCVPAGCSASSDFFAKALQQEYGRSMLVTSSTVLVQKARMQGVNAVNFDYLANAVLRRCGWGIFCKRYRNRGGFPILRS